MLAFDPIIEEIQKAAAWIAGVSGVVVVAWYRLRKMTASDNKETQADDATAAVITLLRNEVERLSEQNTKLAELVNDLQLQVVRLHQENAKLRNDVLRIENASKVS